MSPLQILRLRILDLLVDDEEMVDQLYIHCNYSFCDWNLTAFATQYSLAQFIMQIRQLEIDQYVTVRLLPDYPSYVGYAAANISITEKGRDVLLAANPDPTILYKVLVNR